jgi:hypothetical protein
MHAATLVFAGACLAAGALSLLVKDRVAAYFCLALLGLCGGATLLWQINALQFVPMLDLPIAIGSYIAWRENPTEWRPAFAAIMALRLPVHVAGDYLGQAQQIAYYHTVNATFLAALGVLASGGITNVANRCERFVFRICGGVARFARVVASEAHR